MAIGLFSRAHIICTHTYIHLYICTSQHLHPSNIPGSVHFDGDCCKTESSTADHWMIMVLSTIAYYIIIKIKCITYYYVQRMRIQVNFTKGYMLATIEGDSISTSGSTSDPSAVVCNTKSNR